MSTSKDVPLLRKIQESVPDCTYRVDIAIDWIERALELYKVDRDPEYQRGHVWNEAQQRAFVGTLLETPRSVPIFWFNWTNKKYDRSDSEVVDGKQRLAAVLRWINNEIPAECPCGIRVYYGELDAVSLRRLTIVTMSWHFVHLSRRDVMKFYLRLNSGGTVHTQDELDRVRRLLEKEDRP